MHIREKHSEIRSQPPKQETNWLGCAAGRALGELLSSIYGPMTRAWLTKQRDGVSPDKGLHVGCGDVRDTFQLASLLFKGSSLTGPGEDPVLMERALFEKESKELQHINFLNTRLSGFKKDEELENIFIQLLNPGFLVNAMEWASLARLLKTGGVLYLQVLDLSGYHSFPYNHAFARSVELISNLKRTALCESISKCFVLEQLQEVGLEAFDTTFSPPAFITKDNNQILSFLLEWRQEEILTSGYASREEFNSLLLELKQYESQIDTIISRPGMYQICARKTDGIRIQ